MVEKTKIVSLHKTQKSLPLSHFQKTFSDYNKEFLYPEEGLSFHFCDNWSGFLHTHNYYEFFIVTKGKLKHIINGITEELSCGTIYFITPTDEHIILPLKGHDSQHINIAVTPEKLETICRSINTSIFSILTKKAFSHNLEESDFSFFISKSEKLSVLYSQAEDDTANQLYILEMLTVAISCSYRKIFCANASLPDWFNILLDDLNRMNFGNLTPSSVYKKANYSPATIVKYFKEYLGKTIVEYTTELKVQRACALLVNTNYQIITISGMAGFDTLQSFNRSFKKCMKITPSEYRSSKKINIK